MPQNPLEALRKASGMSAPPGRVTLPDAAMDASIDDPGNWVRGEMPMGPRTPKMGGELYQVLERAALKSGMGQAPNAIEGELLGRYSQPLLQKPELPVIDLEPPRPEGTIGNYDKYSKLMENGGAGARDALRVTNTFKPWAGLAQLREKLGF